MKRVGIFWEFVLAMSLLLLAAGCRSRKPAPKPPVAIRTDTAKLTIPHSISYPSRRIRVAAELTENYFPWLMGKRIGLVVNHTSLLAGRHLVDTLKAAGMDIRLVFAPEHGFRGEAANGEHVSSETDKATGLKITSLYGKKKAPDSLDLAQLDLILFDIQDVGVRFYTYVSTLHYVAKACARYGKELLVLDRPNPNARFVEGPMLDTANRSIVGIYPVPLVHGCTVGELIRMAKGQGWLPQSLSLQVIPCANYAHDSAWALPIRPSPNLPNQQSIRLYASLGLFEGTTLSMGRGTGFPFQVVGGPAKEYGRFTFTPLNRPGALSPPHDGVLCHGLDLRDTTLSSGLDVGLIVEMYRRHLRSGQKPEAFFKAFLTKLSGSDRLRQDLIAGKSAAEITQSWQADIDQYKAMRQAYLLYP